MAITYLPALTQDPGHATPVEAMPDKAPPESVALAPEVNAPQVEEVALIQPDQPIPEIQALPLPVADEFVVNKQLPAPWDFDAVLMLSPEGSSGLTDFFASAQRMDALGLCHFAYTSSRFHGEGAATEIVAALHSALDAWAATTATPPDAILLVSDAASVVDPTWLQDADLAHYLGSLPIPVWTGLELGLEGDPTLVATAVHTRFDTPAKLMRGIQQVIAERAAEAKFNFEQLSKAATRIVQSARKMADTLDVSVSTQARRQLAQSRLSTETLMGAINAHAARTCPEQDSVG